MAKICQIVAAGNSRILLPPALTTPGWFDRISNEEIARFAGTALSQASKLGGALLREASQIRIRLRDVLHGLVDTLVNRQFVVKDYLSLVTGQLFQEQDQ